MHFDCLDEIYAMVQSNLQFDKLVYTGLTGSYDLLSKDPGRDAKRDIQPMTLKNILVNDKLYR